MIKAVIFDMDGVIVDSEPLHERAVSEVLHAHGKEQTQEAKMKSKGMRIHDVFAMHFRILGINAPVEKAAARHNEIMLRLIAREGTAHSGAMELIKALKGRVRLALASSAPQSLIDAVLGKLSLKGAFERVVSADDVGMGKPAPDIYVEAARQLGVKPAECLVIEDSINGVLAAKAAGMKCLAVTNTFPAGELLEAGADYVVSSLMGFDFGKYTA